LQLLVHFSGMGLFREKKLLLFDFIMKKKKEEK
jgi:hypothetical protein